MLCRAIAGTWTRHPNKGCCVASESGGDDPTVVHDVATNGACKEVTSNQTQPVHRPQMAPTRLKRMFSDCTMPSLRCAIAATVLSPASANFDVTRALQHCAATQTCVGITFHGRSRECTLHTSVPVGVTSEGSSRCRQSRCTRYDVDTVSEPTTASPTPPPSTGAPTPSPSPAPTPPPSTANPTSVLTQPNILLILADDAHADNFGAYGGTFFQTPRLDELARTGARWTNCYSTPLCAPSRVKLMTGRSGIRNYRDRPWGGLVPGEVTFGTMMQDSGYRTAIAGKWQLQGSGPTPLSCGFETHCLHNVHAHVDRGSRYFRPTIYQDGERLAVSDSDYGPDIFSSFVIDFMTVGNQTRPFFAYYPMVLLHSPFEKQTPDLHRNDVDVAGFDNANKQTRSYKAMHLYADKLIGNMIDALEAHGLRERTVVIFSEDRCC